MENKKYESESNLENINNFENEIDILQIYKFISRNKKQILITSFIGFFVGIIFSLSLKRQWTGRFQIVLSNNEKKSSSVRLPLALRHNMPSSIGIPSFTKDGDPLKTQVEILKSSSVLKPVYDLVNKNYLEKDENKVLSSYEGWRNKLKVELKKGTSILNLSYTDHNKNLILPVLNMISKEYQKFSRKDRIKGLEKGIKYLDSQIKIYKLKSLDSFREARQFALDNSLTSNLTTTIGLENPSPSRQNNLIGLRDEIQYLKKQKESLNNISGDEALLFVNTYRDLGSSKIYQEIQNIERILIGRSNIYTENDELTKSYKELKNTLTTKFKLLLHDYFNNKIKDSELRLSAIERPDSLVIKYNELTRRASRDNFTLNSLENSRIMLAIDQARSEEPWELISLPTIDTIPSGPQRKLITLFVTSIGVLLGLANSFFYEKRKGFIYSSSEFKKLIPYKFFGELSTSKKENWSEEIKNISKISFLKDQNKISIVSLIDNSFEFKEDILSNFKESSNNFSIDDFNLNQISKYPQQVLVVCLGLTKKDELLKLIRNNDLLNNKVLGWIQINTENTL